MPCAGRDRRSFPARAATLGLLFLAGRKDPLDLDVRRRIFEQVAKYPGLHLREVARALGINPNHAKYHLQRLEKADLVSSRHEDGYWRFWPREKGSIGYRDRLSRQDKAALAVLRRPVPLHVALLLLDRGRATHGDLLDEVDVAHATLHYHMGKMEDSGLVESRKEGRFRWYSLQDPDRVTGLLRQYRPPKTLIRRFLDAWEQVEPSSARLPESGKGRLVLTLQPIDRSVDGSVDASGRRTGTGAGSPAPVADDEDVQDTRGPEGRQGASSEEKRKA